MGLDPKQFRQYVIRPTLEHMGMGGLAAERLMLGTALHESDGLRYIDQVDKAGKPGPAFSLFQIELATHDDLFANFLPFRPGIASQLRKLVAEWPPPAYQLHTNLAYSCAIARLIYYRRPEPLPAADDAHAMASFYKRAFNTSLGKATVDDFLRRWPAVLATEGK